MGAAKLQPLPRSWERQATHEAKEDIKTNCSLITPLTARPKGAMTLLDERLAQTCPD